MSTYLKMSFLGLCLIAGLCLLIVAAKAEHMPDRVFQVSSDWMTEDVSVEGTGCACNQSSEDCGCCAHIKFDKFDIDDDVCVNVTYLPSQIGLDFTLTWNGKALVNKTISAVNPPPICVGIPHVDLLKACVKFSNISYNKDHFGGCISVGLEALGFEKDFPLGCIYSSKKESVRMRRLRRLLRRLVRRRYYMKDFSEFQRMVQRGKNARKESFGDVEN
ncbi:uncharacterized protein LOC125573800 [Nematostella vectensis]|uniref:uncharacterized protein LOC125573800 n=1 Tax=Nematostella vectensis TaxID=45351 RepID=UPI0020777DC0|nr:uncharacterized protein LOC125573800 [Nematostella vectensis]